MGHQLFGPAVLPVAADHHHPRHAGRLEGQHTALYGAQRAHLPVRLDLPPVSALSRRDNQCRRHATTSPFPLLF